MKAGVLPSVVNISRAVVADFANGAEQPAQVAAQRRLAEHHREAVPRAVERLLGGDRLVVRR